MTQQPDLITAAVPAAGVVIGALWFALTDPAKTKATELARGLYWCSLLVTLFIVARMTLSL